MPRSQDPNARRSQAMRRAHREGRLDGRAKLRDLEMATMLHGGATLDEIGALAGGARATCSASVLVWTALIGHLTIRRLEHRTSEPLAGEVPN